MAKQKNSKPPVQAEPVPPKFTVVEPQGGTVYFYANLVQLSWTVVDLKIRFAELTKIEPDGHNTVTERAVATMAWAEAKMLLDVLKKTVASYEQLNGEIKIAPELKLPPGIIPSPIAS
jgi:hypothetical protein